MIGKKQKNRAQKYIIAIAIVAVAAILLGFVFDIVIERIEYGGYPCPDNYAEYVDIYSEKYDVPKNIVYAVMNTESDFKSDAVSHAGAVGLMQLMPETFLWLTTDKTEEHYSVGMLYDPETNIKYGVLYLSLLYERYNNWDCALAAYNAGPTNADEWIQNPEYFNAEKGQFKKIPFKETRRYVRRVKYAADKYSKLYGF